MVDKPDNHQFANRDHQLVQKDIQRQFDEKRSLQERAERLIKWVLVPFGALLPILSLILWIEASTILGLLSLHRITSLAQEATTKTFLQPYQSELILVITVFGFLTLLGHGTYFVFIKFFPGAIEIMSSSEMHSGVKPSRYAAVYGNTDDKKVQQLLLLDLQSALEHNNEVIQNLQMQMDRSVQYLRKGVMLVVSSVLLIFILLITQHPASFVIGGTSAAVVGTLLLLNEVELANYSNLIVHDPRTDLAIVVAVLSVIPVSLFSAGRLIFVGPLVAVVVLSYVAVPLFSIGIPLNTRLAMATRTLLITVIFVVLLGAVQAGVRDLPVTALNLSLGMISSLIYSIGILLLVCVIDAAGQAGSPIAESLIEKLHGRRGEQDE